MTPLEALAHGVPSVLLDTPVAREVYGDARGLVPGPGAIARRRCDALLLDDAPTRAHAHCSPRAPRPAGAAARGRATAADRSARRSKQARRR